MKLFKNHARKNYHPMKQILEFSATVQRKTMTTFGSFVRDGVLVGGVDGGAGQLLALG